MADLSLFKLNKKSQLLNISYSKEILLRNWHNKTYTFNMVLSNLGLTISNTDKYIKGTIGFIYNNLNQIPCYGIIAQAGPIIDGNVVITLIATKDEPTSDFNVCINLESFLTEQEANESKLISTFPTSSSNSSGSPASTIYTNDAIANHEYRPALFYSAEGEDKSVYITHNSRIGIIEDGTILLRKVNRLFMFSQHLLRTDKSINQQSTYATDFNFYDKEALKNNDTTQIGIRSKLNNDFRKGDWINKISFRPAKTEKLDSHSQLTLTSERIKLNANNKILINTEYLSAYSVRKMTFLTESDIYISAVQKNGKTEPASGLKVTHIKGWERQVEYNDNGIIRTEIKTKPTISNFFEISGQNFMSSNLITVNNSICVGQVSRDDNGNLVWGNEYFWAGYDREDIEHTYLRANVNVGNLEFSTLDIRAYDGTQIISPEGFEVKSNANPIRLIADGTDGNPGVYIVGGLTIDNKKITTFSQTFTTTIPVNQSNVIDNVAQSFFSDGKENYTYYFEFLSSTVYDQDLDDDVNYATKGYLLSDNRVFIERAFDSQDLTRLVTIKYRIIKLGKV